MRGNGECQVETEREGSVGPQDQKASPELEVCTVCRATKAKEATKDLRDQRGQQVFLHFKMKIRELMKLTRQILRSSGDGGR